MQNLSELDSFEIIPDHSSGEVKCVKSYNPGSEAALVDQLFPCGELFIFMLK